VAAEPAGAGLVRSAGKAGQQCDAVPLEVAAVGSAGNAEPQERHGTDIEAGLAFDAGFLAGAFAGRAAAFKPGGEQVIWQAGLPEDPPGWNAWQLIAPHSALVFHNVAVELDCTNDAVTAAAHAAYMTARFQTSQGFLAAAEAEFRDVLAAQLRVLGPDHPDTLRTWHQIARRMAARGDHTAAEAECRDVLAAMLRVLGPDHPVLTFSGDTARPAVLS
jgi:plasmid stability protein